MEKWQKIEGVSNYQPEKITAVWVKKLISKRDWGAWYSKNSIYCPIKRQGNSIWIGFLLTNKHLPLKSGSFQLNDEELLALDNYRRARNIRPFVSLGEDKEIKDMPQFEENFGESEIVAEREFSEL